MKLIIAGSRGITDIDTLIKAISCYDLKDKITEIVSGTALGADRLGEIYAEMNNIKLTKFPADWKHYPRSAGYKRNLEMSVYGDALLALWDGKSRGTKHMINVSQKKKMLVHVYNINSPPMFRV